MCGIAGIVSFRKFNSDVINDMTSALSHRGPDDSGFHLDNEVALGHRRLSIIDLSPDGHQPMTNEDGTLWLVFNGEIYDYAALRDRLERNGHTLRSRTDSETLLHLYEEKSERLVDEIAGMFAFAIWDSARRRLLLARDRMGKKPLYYALLPDGIAFASELKALLRHPQITREIDREALEAYLVLGYVPGELSIFRGVRKLLPGSTAVFDESGFRSERYYVPRVEPGAWKADVREYEADLLKKLRVAVERRLVADVEVGIFLSGGIDSSLIAALAAERHPRIRTFSIGFSEAAFDESAHAARVAKTLGTEHIARSLDPAALIDATEHIAANFDEPFADASAAPTLLLSKITSDHVKVALGGDGADELFGGYPTLRAQRWADRLQFLGARDLSRLPDGSGYYPFGYVAKRFAGALGRDPAKRQVAWTSYLSPEEIGWPALPEITGDSEVISRTLDQRLYLADDILVKTDRASMAHSLEVRAPFLDVDVVKCANTLPAELARGKVLLRRILRKTKVGFIAARPKKGFAVPISTWLRGELKDWARERIESARDLPIDQSRIMQMWEEHQSRRRDRWRELWAIAIYSEWEKTWRG